MNGVNSAQKKMYSTK